MKLKKNLLLFSYLLVLMTGCKETAPSSATDSYKTLRIEKQDYTLNRQFMAKIESQERIAVRPAVGGTLVKVCVAEGALVKQGQPIFVIDQAPYIAAVNAAKAQVAFIDGAHQSFGMDHSGMDDETSAGEYYIDCLCVAASYRKQGIATALIKAVIRKAGSLRMPSVGLLVDSGNPEAEHLYTQIGFRYLDDNVWGGHPMKHLVIENKSLSQTI